MPVGVVFALFAYALYSCADATIKSFGNDLSVFEIAFFATLFSLVPAIISKPKKDSWRDLLHLNHPFLVQVRGVAGLFGAGAVIYAFTHIPLAEAYSLVFLAPIFVTLISAVALRERVPGYRWILLGISFAGVLLAVRPGFRELEAGHIAALIGALCAAISTIVLRAVAPSEHRLSIIGVVTTYSLLFNGILMLAAGFQTPTFLQLLLFAGIGALGGTGHLLFIKSTSLAPANQVAPAQYSQICWAVLLGAVFYKEYPDLMCLAGLVIIAGAGVLNVLSQETCIRIISRFSIAAGRQRGVAACPTPVEGSTVSEV